MTELSRRTLFAGAAAVTAASALTPICRSARPAAPLAGQANAGFYRYKVGDFEVTAVDRWHRALSARRCICLKRAGKDEVSAGADAACICRRTR